MDRGKLARRVQTAKNSVSLKPDRAQYAVKKAAKKNLSPLQRLQKFKKLVEKQGKQQKPRVKKNLRVTFAFDMECESVVNGSHEPDIEEMKDQKILKPRKPVLLKEKDAAAEVVPNGSSENGSVADTVEMVNGENGHDEELESSDVKTIKRSSRISEKREGTPKKQIGKESTPKPETSSKRELRRKETPQKETTPKPETPVKRKGKPTKNAKSQSELDTEVKPSENSDSQEKNITNAEDVVMIDEVIIVNDSLDEKKTETKSSSFFSVFRRSSNTNSPDCTNKLSTATPSSPSIVFLDSPSYSERNFTPSSDIRGRKAINAFSRFPGRNVSITSVDSSTSKRKADESICEDSPRKRFAGDTESDSEKSPGWRFFSPKFARMWSPSQQKPQSPLPASTPIGKHAEQDSMAVNYDEDTKLCLDETASVSSKPSPTPTVKSQWLCAVM